MAYNPFQPVQPATSVYEMANTLQTTPSTISPTDDTEKLSSVTRKKPALSSVFSWAASLFHTYSFSSSIIISTILAGTVAGILYQPFHRDTKYIFPPLQYQENGIALVGHSNRVDLNQQRLSMGWDIYGCGDYRKNDSEYAGYWCGILDRPVDIYLNGASNQTYSYDPARFPVDPAQNETLYVQTLITFPMNHDIDSLNPDMVPFDVYRVPISAIVVEKATNATVPIVAFSAGGTADNFVIASPYGTSTMNNFTHDSATGPITDLVKSAVIVIEVKRSKTAQVFTMFLFLINWALAIGSIYITILVHISRAEKMESAVLLLPVTIILTIPALRALYIGSPPFGVYIDTFGFFLQMMIVAVCSMVLLHIVAPPKLTS